MEDVYVLVGWVVKPHGVEGRLVVELFPEFATVESIEAGTEVYLGYSQRFALPYTLQFAVARGKRRLLVQLEQITSREEVYQFQEMGLFAPRSALRFERDTAAAAEHPIVGYEVWEEGAPQPFGTVVDVWEMPAHEVLVVRHQEADYPIPWVEEFVTAVDHQRRKITVRLMEGLSDIAMPLRHTDEQEMDEN